MTVPKSPPAYARSSDMYSHMGTMPRPSTKKAQNRQAAQKAREVGPEPHQVPRGLPDTPGLEADKKVVVETDAPLEDTTAVGPNPSAVEVGPLRKPEDTGTNMEEESAPRNVPPER